MKALEVIETPVHDGRTGLGATAVVLDFERDGDGLIHIGDDELRAVLREHGYEQEVAAVREQIEAVNRRLVAERREK